MAGAKMLSSTWLNSFDCFIAKESLLTELTFDLKSILLLFKSTLVALWSLVEDLRVVMLSSVLEPLVLLMLLLIPV